MTRINIVISDQTLESQSNVWQPWVREELWSAHRSRPASLSSQPEQSAPHSSCFSPWQPHGSYSRRTAACSGLRPCQPLRVSRLLRLRAASHPSVPRRPFSMQQLQAEVDLLSNLQGPTGGEHQEPRHGEGGQHSDVPLQVQQRRLRSPATAHRQGKVLELSSHLTHSLLSAGPRRDLRVPSVLLPLPWSQLQVAGLPRAGHGSPHAGPQVNHHSAGRGHRVPRYRHQSSRYKGLWDFYNVEQNKSALKLFCQ